MMAVRPDDAAGHLPVARRRPLETGIETTEGAPQDPVDTPWLGMDVVRLQKDRAERRLRVSETKQEITVEAAMVAANCVKNRPEIPEMKAVGTKTAQKSSQQRCPFGSTRFGA
jgi:hypothetical protein